MQTWSGQKQQGFAFSNSSLSFCPLLLFLPRHIFIILYLIKNAGNRLSKKLQEISNESGVSIRKVVAKEALEHSYDDPKDFFSDLLSYGCVSGMIGSLVYYYDTHEFFDLHYAEIEELREEYEENLGEPLKIKGDLKNFLAWFAFEEVAYQLALELELEV